MHDFVKRGGVQHRRDGVDVYDLSIDDFESGGRVHPRIRRHDEDARENAADGDNHPGQPVNER